MYGENVDAADGWKFTRRYDRSTERPSEAVVHAVASATNRDVVSIEPIYRTIDPEAMDALIGDDDSTTVAFSYAGCRVAVDVDTVRVHALGEAVGR